MEWVLGVFAGIALAAACGFRVFVPMLVMSIAVQSGHLEPASGFQWLGSWPALICFSIATVVEIAAYFIPVVSNALDSLATPAAAVAGTVLAASMAGDISPVLRWILAAIAGGTAAGGVQLATVAARSAVSPAGGSGLFSVLEDGAAIAASVLAVVLPVLAVVLMASLILIMRRRKLRAAPGI